MSDGVVELARTIGQAAVDRRLAARLLGGTAVAIAAPRAGGLDGLRRPYGDIDMACRSESQVALTDLLATFGIMPDRRFNALHGERRLLFHAPDGMPLDVFVDIFEQCHRLNLRPRLDTPSPALELEDLLLTKLQVVELTRKDVQDACALMLERAPAAAYLGGVLGADWGFFTTFTDNLGRLVELAQPLLARSDLSALDEASTRLRAELERVPKSLAWRVRARVGRRLPWYQLPEDKER